MNIFNFIKERVSISDVVSEYATLKKAGNYLKGRCPFHHEKTASFTVSPHKDIFYCFGCHLGGDAISFIAKIENCNQFEAAQFLAERHNIEIPEELLKSERSGETKEHKDHYYAVCTIVAQWCHEALKKQPSILAYLKSRGISQESIEYFCIGYFPGGHTGIKSLLAYAKQHNVILDDLLEAQILAQGKQVVFSPFEDRIIFPIQNALGKSCGFGGRTYKQTDTRPKYYNSKENDYFTKGSLLFGLDLAKKSIQENGSVFLVEGYTDCVAMAQHGYRNVVATLGTACTAAHLKLLSRYADHLYILYDSDEAGKQAILRLTQLCWQANMELKVVNLPAGQDPDSFLSGQHDLNPHITNAQDIFLYFIESLGAGFSQLPLHEKVAKTRRFMEIIQTVPDQLKVDMLLHKAAKTFDIPFESLKRELSHTQGNTKESGPSASNDTKQKPHSEADLAQNSLEKKIFSAIVGNIGLFKEFGQQLGISFMPSPLRELLQKIEKARSQQESFDFSQFFDTLDSDEKNYVSRLLLEHDQQITTQTFEKLVLELHKKRWKIIVHEVKAKLTHAKLEGDQNKIQKILSEFLSIKQRIILNMNSISSPKEHEEGKN